MQEAMEERKQSQHATDSDKAAHACDTPQWSDRQRNREETKCPVSREFGYIIDGIGAEAAGKTLIYQPQLSTDPQGWQKASDKDDRLQDPPATEFRHSRSVVLA